MRQLSYPNLIMICLLLLQATVFVLARATRSGELPAAADAPISNLAFVDEAIKHLHMGAMDSRTRASLVEVLDDGSVSRRDFLLQAMHASLTSGEAGRWSDAEFIERSYRYLVRREPAAAERVFWGRQLVSTSGPGARLRMFTSLIDHSSSARAPSGRR